MPTYPVTIPRCQHIKVNGVQCGSPALRALPFCHFHDQCAGRHQSKCAPLTLLTLPFEDANAIQFGLSEVVRLLLDGDLNPKIATLILRALRIAAMNVKRLTLEPPPTQVVIDPKSVEQRPLEASAWSTTEGKDYDLPQDAALNQPTPAFEYGPEYRKEHDNDPFVQFQRRNPGLSGMQEDVLWALQHGDYAEAERLRDENQSFLKGNPDDRNTIDEMFKKYHPAYATVETSPEEAPQHPQTHEEDASESTSSAPPASDLTPYSARLSI
jgi:hypothetical protein